MKLRQWMVCVALLCTSCNAVIGGVAQPAPRTFTEIHQQYKDVLLSTANRISAMTGLQSRIVTDHWQGCAAGGRRSIIDVEFSGPITDENWLPALTVVRAMAKDKGADVWLPLEDGLGNHVVSIISGDTQTKFMFGTQERGMLSVDTPCGRYET